MTDDLKPDPLLRTESTMNAFDVTETIRQLTEPGKIRTAFQDGMNYAVMELLRNSEGHTLFGRRMKVTIEWPDGKPAEDLLDVGYQRTRRRAAEILRWEDR